MTAGLQVGRVEFGPGTKPAYPYLPPGTHRNILARPVEAPVDVVAALEPRRRPAQVLGLTGYSGSGKDQIGRVLVHAYGFERMAFADPIREVLLQTNPDIEDAVRTGTLILPGKKYCLRDIVAMKGWGYAKSLPEVRGMLQRLGEAGRGALGQGVWLEALFGRLRPGRKYVITDVRYYNEFARILHEGGSVVRVVRPGVGPVNDHASETALDGREMPEVLNSGTIDDLVVMAGQLARDFEAGTMRARYSPMQSKTQEVTL